MKIKFAIITITLITLLSSCYRVKPDAGEESVIVYKPVFFGHGGVDETPISTGSEWAVFSTDHVEFNITPQAIDEVQENVMTKDNTPVTVYSTLKYQIQSGKTPTLYKKFGVKWFENSISAMFYSMIRNKCSEYKMFDLASNRDALVKIENDIYDSIKNYTVSQQIPVDILQVVLGKITPPDEVIDETKKTAAQNQSILTQTSRAQSELSRKQADINKAIADQAYQLQMGMTIDEYLRLRQLEIEKEKVELIKDNKNISIIFGNANPVLPIK